MTDQAIERPTLGLEVATSGDGRDITKPFIGSMLVPADRVLARRGAGDLAIYEQVLSDPQVKACFEQRRSAVTSCEWQVDAASDRPADKRAAEFVEKQLRKVSFDNLTDKMLYSVFYGYAAAELIYEVDDGLIGWKAIKVRNRRRFRFKADGELRMLTVANPMEGMACKAPYFWTIATGADHDDEPYGQGLGHWCYWPTLFKRNGIAFWLTFLEKFAAPTAVGHYPAGAQKETINTLLQALAAIRTDSAIALPEGMKAELLEAARGGSADYKVVHDTMDSAIAKAILGQTMTTENGSSKSQAEVHMDVRQDIVKADADLICESLNLGPIRWLTMFNFPDADPPRVFRVVQEPEDADTLAERDTKVAGLGFKPGLEYIRETYGDHWVEKIVEAGTEEGLNVAIGRARRNDGALSPGEAAVAFADVPSIEAQREDAQARIDALVVQASKFGLEWRTFVAPRVEELQVMLDQADDLQAFRARVIELADAPANTDLADALARCSFAANLLGRSKGV